MTSKYGPAGVIIKRVIRRLLRFATADLQSSIEQLTKRNSELSSAIIDLATSVTALESKVSRDLSSICRDIVRTRAGTLENSVLKSRLEDLYAEIKRLELQVENELRTSGAQRSFCQREIDRLAHDMDVHIAKCERTSGVNSVDLPARSSTGAL